MTKAEAEAKIAAWQRTQLKELTVWFKNATKSIRGKKISVAKKLDNEKTKTRIAKLRATIKKIRP